MRPIAFFDGVQKMQKQPGIFLLAIAQMKIRNEQGFVA